MAATAKRLNCLSLRLLNRYLYLLLKGNVRLIKMFKSNQNQNVYSSVTYVTRQNQIKILNSGHDRYMSIPTLPIGTYSQESRNARESFFDHKLQALASGCLLVKGFI